MKTYKFISAVTFCLFFIFFAQSTASAQSLSVLDVVNLLNSYICKDCSCDEFGNCSCDNCTYDNVTLTEFLSGEDCKCTSCFDPNDNITDNSTDNSTILADIFGSDNSSSGDNDTSIDDLLDMTCQSCTCDNETVRHLKEMFMNATDFSTCENKWDLVKKEQNTVDEFTKHLRKELKFVPYAPIIYVSALTGSRVDKIFELLNTVNEAYKTKISTSLLNRVIRDAQMMNEAPDFNGGRLKITYVQQVGIMPPKFALFVNNPSFMHFSYQRYLENRLRDSFNLDGTPIDFVLRKK